VQPSEILGWFCVAAAGILWVAYEILRLRRRASKVTTLGRLVGVVVTRYKSQDEPGVSFVAIEDSNFDLIVNVLASNNVVIIAKTEVVGSKEIHHEKK